jgi:uncharacterized membrane protein
MVSVLAGVVAGVLVPASLQAVTRALIGWNVAVWLYLLLVGAMMLREDHEHLRRVAMAQAEGAAIVLGMVVLAAVASLAGIVVELSAAKGAGAAHALPHVLFAVLTVVGSWILLPTMFALTYASRYYSSANSQGLHFPDSDAEFKPGYADFLYVAFTIAVAAQTSDVSISTPAMRRLVLLQSVLAFAFNTAILAFTVNIAASMF